MAEDHRHCIICGKAVPPEKFICSPPCEGVFRKHQKRMARTRIFVLAMFIVFFMLVLVVSALKVAS